MDIIKFFDITNVFFTIANYPVSYIEFIGSLAGIIAVYYAAKSDIKTWPIGLINIILFFIIFYKVQLYSDMFLQCYFFGISIYGWIYWIGREKEHKPIQILNLQQRIKLALIVLVSTILFGYFISNIHVYFPALFPRPAAFAYADSFVAVTSVVANTLMARRIFENWFLWIVVDIICVYLYFSKDIVFVSIEYFIFLCLAVYGHSSWWNEYSKAKLKTV